MTQVSNTSLRTAMILAAGRGERMRPLTDTTPKPLLMAGDKRLIEWQIEGLVKAGVQRIVINHAWLGKQFEQALGGGIGQNTRFGCELLYSPETVALETAGGIAKALPMLGDAPFIVVSGDIHSSYDYRNLPTNLGSHAAYLVLVTNPTYNSNGDMGLEHGLIAPQAINKYTYANIGVFSPNIFKSLDPTIKHKVFPWLYAQGSISGELFMGEWHNVGTPQQLAELNAVLNQKSQRN